MNTEENKTTDEKLKAAERKSHIWIENSPVCTKILDLNFNLQFMSSSGIKALKIDDISEHYGKPFPFYFYPKSSKDTLNDYLKKSKDTGEVVSVEAPVHDVNGDELWFHTTVVPVKDDNGEIEYMMVVSIDTTDRKKTELALQERNKELESFYDITVNRENKMITLKEKIEELEEQLKKHKKE